MSIASLMVQDANDIRPNLVNKFNNKLTRLVFVTSTPMRVILLWLFDPSLNSNLGLVA